MDSMTKMRVMLVLVMKDDITHQHIYLTPTYLLAWVAEAKYLY